MMSIKQADWKLEPCLAKAGEVNWSFSRPRRGGIILYDDKGFYLGVYKSKELTDLGGEINYIYEDTIEGSIREYSEECLNCLPELKWLQVFASDVVLGNSIVIFLVKVDKCLKESISLFRNIRKNKKRLEISDIVYVTKEELCNATIYKKIRPLIEHVIKYFNMG